MSRRNKDKEPNNTTLAFSILAIGVLTSVLFLVITFGLMSG